MENSLNDLHLNNALLAALYGHSLVVKEENKNKPGKPSKDKTGQQIKYLGNYEKKVCILVNNPDHTFLPEEQLTFLTKMLTACQMNTGDVAIVNLAHGNITFDQVIQELAPLKIIAFGTNASQAFFKIENRDGIQYLNAPDLGELVTETEASRKLKGNLWAGLKDLFGIK